jgi:hypothetical protein
MLRSYFWAAVGFANVVTGHHLCIDIGTTSTYGIILVFDRYRRRYLRLRTRSGPLPSYIAAHDTHDSPWPLRRLDHENFAQVVEASPEDQLKAPTLTLLREVGDLFGLRVVGRTEAHPIEAEGRPDIGVAVGGLLGGFIELKRPGLGSNPERLRGEQNKAQWRKFQTLPNLIYSDGNSWSLYRTGEPVGRSVSISGDFRASSRRLPGRRDRQAAIDRSRSGTRR